MFFFFNLLGETLMMIV